MDGKEFEKFLKSEVLPYDPEDELQLEEPYKDEFGAWHRIMIYEESNGKVSVVHSTNDNLDRGYPSEYATWTETYKSVDEALSFTGKSRTGVVGCIVEVYVNNEKV